MKAIHVFFLFTAVTAIPTVIYPSADSYLDSLSPNNNYGGSSSGFAMKDTILGNYYDLVTKFNISGLPPVVSGVVTYFQMWEAVEEIFGPYIVFDCYETYSNWTESAVTWNNPPTTKSQILWDYQDDDVTIVSFPITSIIAAAQANGDSYVSFRTHSEYPPVEVFMKEASISNRAQLLFS